MDSIIRRLALDCSPGTDCVSVLNGVALCVNGSNHNSIRRCSGIKVIRALRDSNRCRSFGIIAVLRVIVSLAIIRNFNDRIGNVDIKRNVLFRVVTGIIRNTDIYLHIT